MAGKFRYCSVFNLSRPFLLLDLRIPLVRALPGQCSQEASSVSGLEGMQAPDAADHPENNQLIVHGRNVNSAWSENVQRKKKNMNPPHVAQHSFGEGGPMTTMTNGSAALPVIESRPPLSPRTWTIFLTSTYSMRSTFSISPAVATSTSERAWFLQKS